jgi:hypothetical protein
MMASPSDDYAAWREALAGGKPGLHEDEPWCGYFQTRDHAATKMLPKGRWPQIACAIWRGEDGKLVAERGGKLVPVDWVWPHAAKRPITFEAYSYWHQHGQWPAEAA